jgi:hypothetical protein
VRADSVYAYKRKRRRIGTSAWRGLSLQSKRQTLSAIPLAHRYLGTELGDRYIEDTRNVVGGVFVRMRPERWLTVDYAKHDAWEPRFAR